MKMISFNKHLTLNIQRPTSNGEGRGLQPASTAIGGIMLKQHKCRAPQTALLVLLAGAVFTFAQSNSIPGPQDYKAFSQFITDRNIFDPNRQPHNYDPNHHFVPRSRPNWTPGIQFVGTMSYAKGWFAFFSGNSSDLSKVAQVGSQIAGGYTVTDITANFVVLEPADKKEQAQLKIGDGLREENSKWILAKAGDLAVVDDASQTTTANPSSTESSSATPPPSASEPNDVLKRLMQLREKENQ